MPSRRPRAFLCMERGGLYVPRSRRPALTSAEDVIRFLTPLFPLKFPQEAFLVLLLDARNRVNQALVVSLGTLTASIVHPREVFAPAIAHRAASVIVAHNHPSGDPSPSGDDVALTKRLIKIGELLGIEVLDHVIIGNGSHHSMKSHGDPFR